MNAVDKSTTPKLVLSLDGVVLREVALSKDRTTIGRRSHNDVVIDNLAVSGEHAVLVANGDEAYLEDLGSTNGTTVNGQPIKKHLLQIGDTVEIGKYRLRYLRDGMGSDDTIDLDTSQPMGRPYYGPAPDTIQVRSPALAGQSAPGAPQGNSVRILTGPNAGREMPLLKALTTVGRPGHQVAVITRRPTGFFIAHVEGEVFPVVNGQNLGSAAHPLRHGDIIELAGVKMEFSGASA